MKTKYTVLLFALISLSAVHAYGLAPKDDKGLASVVVISSLDKILQDNTDVNGTTAAKVFCARNESESFQIIVVNKTDKELADIDLQKSKWEYTGEQPLGAPVMRMFREHYVEIKRPPPRSKTKGGLYPDALIPFINPYTGRRITKAKYLASGHNVKPKTSQGYWIDIDVAKDVKAGTYTNEIKVSAAGKQIAVVPVEVVVWDFELPEFHKFKTYFSIIRDVSGYHNTSSKDLKYRTIERRYRLMLRDHGATSIFDEPYINMATGEPVFSKDFVRRLKNFTDEMRPSVIRVRSRFDDEPIKRARYLSSWESFLRRNRWLPEPITYRDEPTTKADYLKIIKYGKAVDIHAPSVKLLVTEQVRPQEPGFPSLEGAVDIWVPAWYRANPRDIKRRQEAGDEVWSYIHGENPGLANWLIEFPPLNYRIPAWFSWSLDLKGFLYWQTTSWSRGDYKIDPWINPRTWPPANFSSGEGSLLYPGAAAGIDGPVASIRLKVFRDGVEDYDYFSILSELAGANEARNITEKVASSFRVYSKNPDDYIKARKLIAGKIQELSAN